jgi:hypothetical protein
MCKSRSYATIGSETNSSEDPGLSSPFISKYHSRWLKITQKKHYDFAGTQ